MEAETAERIFHRAKKMNTRRFDARLSSAVCVLDSGKAYRNVTIWFHRLLKPRE